MSTDRTPLGAVLLGALLLAPCAATAQGFAAMVTPPRFELEGKPGETQRHVIEIMNADNQSASYHMRTADWTLDANDVVQLSEALTPGSCRPWVAIERRDVSVGSGARYRYRFEVTPPADATGECRFAVVLTGGADTVNAGQIKIPISGQIAVIVYLTLDGAKPALEVLGSSVVERQGRKVPVIRVRNTGTAHTRLEGFLKGVDPGGKRVEFTPSGLPILPGETREIALDAAGEGDTRPDVPYPIVISGTLEWSGQTTPFEAHFAP